MVNDGDGDGDGDDDDDSCGCWIALQICVCHCIVHTRYISDLQSLNCLDATSAQIREVWTQIATIGNSRDERSVAGCFRSTREVEGNRNCGMVMGLEMMMLMVMGMGMVMAQELSHTLFLSIQIRLEFFIVFPKEITNTKHGFETVLLQKFVKTTHQSVEATTDRSNNGAKIHTLH